MKKGCIFLLLLISLLFSSSFTCSAAYDDYSLYEAYGICVVSKVLEYDDNFNIDKAVDAESYKKIMNFWFGNEFTIEKNPTNADFIFDIAKYVSKTDDNQNTITSFKDFGFIKKEHRSAYKKMCSQGYLDFEDEFLNPNYPLSYRYMFNLLICFEDEIKYANKFDITTGVITDAYSEGNNIVLKQSSEKKQIEYKFNRIHTFMVQDKNAVSPYSYNVKRGSNVKIYTVDDEILYVSIKQKERSFSDDYTVQYAKIYLCNPHDKEMIFINNADGSYVTYSYDENVMIFENTVKSSVDNINTSFIDKNCYFIVEKATNAIKYINITG